MEIITKKIKNVFKFSYLLFYYFVVLENQMTTTNQHGEYTNY